MNIAVAEKYRILLCFQATAATGANFDDFLETAFQFKTLKKTVFYYFFGIQLVARWQ